MCCRWTRLLFLLRLCCHSLGLGHEGGHLVRNLGQLGLDLVQHRVDLCLVVNVDLKDKNDKYSVKAVVSKYFALCGTNKLSITLHCKMNRFLMIKSTPEMRVVPKYYLNNPLQLLFNDNLKILNSKNCLLAH